MVKRILVLTDSLGLPRELPETCEFEDTWPYLLKEKFLVHQVSIGGGTINDLFRQVSYHKMFKPDIVIIQSGIVDCAPRSLNHFELDFIKRVPFISNIILKLIKKNSKILRKVRGVRYTPPKEFQKKLSQIKMILNDSEIYPLSILPSSEDYEKKVPGITHSIAKYNSILKELYLDKFIDLNDIPREFIMSDSIHLNSKGQKYIYELILERLSNA
ncbi:SGNH/GDSL hydrolase family protein [Mangrovivirga sp. M17]|uniref:SGNH/GDSL hydrolase family protein n=1 Tax=Mangrovivirga halotolerans TaxID=2993936 RepID=A0ABT3RVC8_9BACT|nr:SGNH/GDSL hydrolase family protein [Mangrovivirga halotolerans]MCX2745192.1 SGNH/GDSL hydrolase family protein [Mangrovivirga halotolerans]